MTVLSGSSAFFLRIAVSLVAVAISAVAPAVAAESGNGSRNFSPPATVPNYFANEAGPMVGGAAESRRTPYSGATASAPTAATPAPAAPAAVRAAPAVAAAAPVARAREHIAMAVPRTRMVHGRHTEIVRTAAHGRSVAHAGARRGYERERVTHTAARTTRSTHTSTHAVSRTTARGGAGTHRRGRG